MRSSQPCLFASVSRVASRKPGSQTATPSGVMVLSLSISDRSRTMPPWSGIHCPVIPGSSTTHREGNISLPGITGDSEYFVDMDGLHRDVA